MQFQYDRFLLRRQLNVYHIVCRIGKNGDACDIIKRYRYGFAVARDGEDHVTSEAHADLKLPKPVFELYGTTKNTFWMAHQEYFSSDNMGKPFTNKFQNPKNVKK